MLKVDVNGFSFHCDVPVQMSCFVWSKNVQSSILSLLLVLSAVQVSICFAIACANCIKVLINSSLYGVVFYCQNSMIATFVPLFLRSCRFFFFILNVVQSSSFVYELF